MFAIVKTGGKQLKVQHNDVISVEKLEAEKGSKIKLDQVLAVSNDGKLSVGDSVSGKAYVEAEVIDHKKDDKVIIFKKKRRQNYRRKNGHRQQKTVLKILNIKAA